MKSSFTFLRVRGIEIGAHWSWLFVFFLVVYSLTATVFPDAYPDLSTGGYVVMGFIAAALFFLSILLHELGHAFAALREGVRIDGITLWLFGGVARFSGMLPSPKAEFKIAIAGPAVSLALAALLGAAGWAAGTLGVVDQATGILIYVARLNAIILIFNLVPALPLDGGRLLHAWLWWRQASYTAATRSASLAGRLFAGTLVVVGVLNLLSGGSNGLWLILLGWFVRQAALGEADLAIVRAALGDQTVADVMTRAPEVVTPDVPVDRFLDEHLGPRSHSAYPVVDEERPVGLVSLSLAGSVPEGERSVKRVGDVMLPLASVPKAQADGRLLDRLADLQEPPRRLLVVDGGRLQGIVSISDALRTLERERLRSKEESEARGPGAGVWIVVGLAMLLAGGYLYHPPMALIKPGITRDVMEGVEISGVTTTPTEGDYRLVTVNIERPNGLGLAWSLLEPNDEMIPLSQVIPPSVDPEEYQRAQQEVFDQSRMIAAAAAARAAGLTVDLEGSGAQVVDVVAGSPADEVLRAGDVITAADGSTVEVATQVSESLNSKPVGSLFVLTVLRDGRRIEVEIETRSLPETQGAGIGAYLTTKDFSIDLPFEISFPEVDIGGPSAGLAHALGIFDALDREDRAAGRRIVATGTIDLQGVVGPIGGVDAKAVAAEHGDADLFLVPLGQLKEVDEEGLQVRGTHTLERALQLLERTASQGGA